MPLKKSAGNMYPWVTHMHTHLGGECPHKCSYCYVGDSIPKRFRKAPNATGRPPRYSGPLRMLASELNVGYGAGRTIFIDHCNDLFAEDVPTHWIMDVLDHCATFPDNVYVYQTKNPDRFRDFLAWTLPDCMLGCTLETNREISSSISLAPIPVARATAMRALSGVRKLFVTIEPIMDFDVPILADWLQEIRPAFVNIGADSKHHNLPEPSRDKVLALIDVLGFFGIEIRNKHNLSRLIGDHP